jgi:acyl carrier protein
MKQNFETNSGLSEQDVAKVQQILIQQLDVTKEQLTPDARIMEDLGADSLDVVEIIMNLEETFEITIPDEEAEKGSTVEDLCKVAATLRGRG